MDPLMHYLSLVGVNFILTAVPFLTVGFILLTIRFNVIYRRQRIDDFHRKRVFITGTDSGFGLELTLKLDKKGLIVYAGCYTDEGCRKLRAQTSNNVHVLQIDVTKTSTLVAAKQFIENDLPNGEGLWGIVNNAGVIRGLLIDFCGENDFKETMEVNFFGAIRVVELFGPLVKKARGRIVNVTSVLGRCPIGAEPYTCAKHALEAYSNGLRRAMKTFGVHVAIIEPGFYRTNVTSTALWNSELDRTWNQMSESLQDQYGQEYKEIVRRRLNLLNEYSPMTSLNKVHHVSDAMAHALSSTRPKDRYVCGIDALLLIRVVTLTPDWILDLFLRYAMQYHKVAVAQSQILTT